MDTIPENAEELIDQGLRLAQGGDLRQALTLLRRAVRLEPNSAQAHAGLGDVRYRLGELPAAVRCWEEALAIDPNHAKARRWLELVEPQLDRPRRRAGIAALPAPQSGTSQASRDGAPPRGRVIPEIIRSAVPEDTPTAMFWPRLVAMAIDWFLMGLLGGVLGMLIAAWRLPEAAHAFRDLLSMQTAVHGGLATLVLVCIYTAWWHASTGQTLGQNLMGLLVVGPDGEPPTPSRSLLRVASAGLNILTLGVGYFLALGRQGRGLHDRLAGTRVVAAQVNIQGWTGFFYAAPTTIFVVMLLTSFIMLPNAINARRRAEIGQSRVHLNTIGRALEGYRVVEGRYPDNLTSLTTPIAYMSALPKDPFSPGAAEYYDYAVHPSHTFWVIAGRGPNRTFEVDTAELVERSVSVTDVGELVQGKEFRPDYGLLSGGDLLLWGGAHLNK